MVRPPKPPAPKAAREAEPDQADRELAALLHALAHDLLAPLRTIEGFAHLLEARHAAALPPEARELLERVRSGSAEMAAMVRSLQALADVSGRDMATEQVDLSALARDVGREVGQLEPERRVALAVEDGIQARGDPMLLRLVVAHLLGNAWKLTRTRKDAKVEVGSTTVSGERVIFVRDNGAGFDMAMKGKLFTPFGRLHDQAEFEGAGMGLAIVRCIVRRHGGRVWAEGELGVGSTFYLTL